MTGTDIGTLLLGLAALVTALGSLRRSKSNERRSKANEGHVADLNKQVSTLRRHLRIVVAALAASERENQRLQAELAARNPIVRSQRRRDDAPPH